MPIVPSRSFFSRTPVVLTFLYAFLTTGCGEMDTRHDETIAATAPPQMQAAPLHTQSIKRNEHAHLEQDYAAMRAGQVSNVRYTLDINLDKADAAFNGTTKILFTLAENNQSPVTIDFNGGKVESVKLNTEAINWEYNGWFITLPANQLSSGEHSVTIEYSRPYASDGDGLHRFIDSETGREYLYTNFEPYNANKLFPHFDQPNIKAPYDLIVTAPADWQVISATRETSVTEVSGRKLWRFPTTAPISSYIFPLHAGPYHVWEDSYTDAHGTIPLRLFARKEIAQYVVLEDWLVPTKESFAFFNNYFDIAYPFGKYDQIIVPDFNAGAMENLGAVTFTERFVSRGEKLQAQRARLANVIAHEMAHMWFGNLVTMNWWNGLWLNESFATYMANLELAEASEFSSAWGTFYSRTKQWAYQTDQQVTTHPIELPVNTTAEAFTNFDGITYGKGASVLKQLPFYLGEENFRRGVVNYLKAHRYGNTELEDFIGALGEAANTDLTQWTQEWLYESGVNTITAEFSCQNNLLSSMVIIQSSPKDMDLPTLRSQRVQLGLYTVSGTNAPATKITAIPVLYSGERTQVDLSKQKNTACPDLIYPNLDDWAYVKVTLDPISQATLKKHILQFDDSNLRLMLWQSLWDSVEEYAITLDEFVHFATANLSQDTSARITSQVTRQLIYANLYYWKLDQTGKEYREQRQKIEDFLWLAAQSASPGSDNQKTYFDSWAAVASSKKHLGTVRKLLSGQSKLEGMTLDQDRRWNLVIKLNEHAYSGYQTITKKEIQRDSSDRGKLQAFSANAARPSPSTKNKWLTQITGINGKYKLAEISAVMKHLFPASQNALKEEFSDQLIHALPDLAKQQDERFLSRYTRYLNAATCSPTSVSQLNKAIEKYGDLTPTIHKSLRINHQHDARCVEIGKRLTAMKK